MTIEAALSAIAINSPGRWAIVGACLAVLLVAYFFASNRMLRRKRDSFMRREDLSPQTIYESFYRADGVPYETVQACLADISSATEIPVERIRPTDRFAVELAPAKGWEHDDGIWLLSDDMAKAMRTMGLDPKTTEIATVDDYIRLHARFHNGQQRAP